jgi:hypothetical protein
MGGRRGGLRNSGLGESLAGGAGDGEDQGQAGGGADDALSKIGDGGFQAFGKGHDLGPWFEEA